ncbi:endolytic transglycosylase MltG [Thiomicrospira microaerophila]|uniref:endolytic transglycosylase MltG n=1 Tax=Thiomicrospira microaerophila TaxID=406020 RepID=UPI00200E52CB|nr:endolytic transglycosylase MltG [Thiomicrospira microaerophila]UQB42983.1 endolytic transglycosylase MltG [Thiomicrospira microaerophila]
MASSSNKTTDAQASDNPIDLQAKTLTLCGLRCWAWRSAWLFVGLLLASALVWSYGYYLLNKPISQQQNLTIIELSAGTSARRMIYSLNQAGLLDHPRAFEWYLRYHQLAHQLRPGELEVNPDWTFSELAQALISGQRVRYPFVIIPGETLAQVRYKLAALPKINHVLDDQAWLSLGDQLGVGDNLEGWLLPETYYYHKGETDLVLVSQAVRSMQQVLDQAWQNKAEGLPLKNPYEALILASIIEKETGAAHERNKISGVFVRRLQRGMRLQTDPTVIYGMGDLYQGRIGRAGLDTWTPYNTYRNHGLTPTPIAMPSRESVLAAVNPDDSEALFFVSKGNGEHHFSATLDEHNRAVRRYILNR